jgi:hypothetical protein
MNGKPELEFTPVEAFAWTPVDQRCPGLEERILVEDRASGTMTRLLRFPPGADTSALGRMIHPFWEEVYILEGEIRDTVLGVTFSAGAYACRPPGMAHGPWTSARGCVTFEVRYRADPTIRD